jgi:hypothetical protein
MTVVKEGKKQMENNTKEMFETYDLATVAILEYFDFPIREIKGDRRKSVVFDNTIELQELVDDFILGKLKVDPLKFSDQIRRTKYKILNAN